MVKKKKNNKLLKTRYLLIAAAALLVVIGSALAVTAINTYRKNQTIAESTKPEADELKAKGNKFLDEGKTQQAKQMFETAKKQYEYVVENSDDQTTVDYAKMNVIDCEAQIWMIDHQ
jgi:outer membrane protein assembly factor BamD (BamD/ComL family)